MARRKPTKVKRNPSVQYDNPIVKLNVAVLGRFISPKGRGDLFSRFEERTSNGGIPVRIWYQVGVDHPEGEIYRRAVVGTTEEERLLNENEGSVKGFREGPEGILVPSLATEVITVYDRMSFDALPKNYREINGYTYDYTFTWGPNRPAMTENAHRRLDLTKEKFDLDNLVVLGKR